MGDKQKGLEGRADGERNIITDCEGFFGDSRKICVFTFEEFPPY
jgi:hypothetical protein